MHAHIKKKKKNIVRRDIRYSLMLVVLICTQYVKEIVICKRSRSKKKKKKQKITVHKIKIFYLLEDDIIYKFFLLLLRKLLRNSKNYFSKVSSVFQSKILLYVKLLVQI